MTHVDTPAKARLITAAPEMLATLIDVQDELERIYQTQSVDKVFERRLARVNAAIKKAMKS